MYANVVAKTTTRNEVKCHESKYLSPTAMDMTNIDIVKLKLPYTLTLITKVTTVSIYKNLNEAYLKHTFYF